MQKRLSHSEIYLHMVKINFLHCMSWSLFSTIYRIILIHSLKMNEKTLQFALDLLYFICLPISFRCFPVSNYLKWMCPRKSDPVPKTIFTGFGRTLLLHFCREVSYKFVFYKYMFLRLLCKGQCKNATLTRAVAGVHANKYGKWQVYSEMYSFRVLISALIIL